MWLLVFLSWPVHPRALQELLRASLVVTGLARRLALPLEVTELVAGAAAAHPLRQVQVSDGRGGTEAMAVRRLAARQVEDVPDLKVGRWGWGARSRHRCGIISGLGRGYV